MPFASDPADLLGGSASRRLERELKESRAALESLRAELDADEEAATVFRDPLSPLAGPTLVRQELGERKIWPTTFGQSTSAQISPPRSWEARHGESLRRRT